jgi:hypothetical protein
MKETTNFVKKNLILITIITLMVLVLSFFVLKTNIFNSTVNQSNSSLAISTVILPSTLSLSGGSQAVLDQVAGRVNPKNIIFLFPNQTNTGQGDIATTNRRWQLENAYFDPANDVMAKLNLPLDDSVFNLKNDPTDLIQSAKNAFPDTKIVPIMVKQSATALELDSLTDNLHLACGNSCLVVSATDFSEGQAPSVGAIHDLDSLKVLAGLDYNAVWRLEAGSNPILYLALKWADLNKTDYFNLASHVNSGLSQHLPDEAANSAILGWYEAGQKQPVPGQTFVAGFNLQKLADLRLSTGLDQKIDLNNNHDMAMTCFGNSQYCALNRLFWGPNFYRDILNGLVVEGQITSNQYKLVLVPTDPTSHTVLTGDAKLKEINRIRGKLGLANTTVSDGYDTLVLPQ